MREPTTAPPVRVSPLTVAALASLGAGAIHASAVGMHSEDVEAVIAFTAVAAFQLGWGALVLTRWSVPLALVGIVGNAGVLGGWLLAKTEGIGFVRGLDSAESVQLADGAAAALAMLAAAAALFGLLGLERVFRSLRAGSTVVSGAAVAVVVIALTGMVATGNHEHADGAHGDAHADGAASHSDGHATDQQEGQEAAAQAIVPPQPYDPTKPIDLGGVEGVTPEQQARAENLIAVSLLRLPRYAEPATAEADGFHSIGDAATGDEHYVNWSYLNDDKILDPDYPESLVYQVRNGEKTLVAAMFMMPEGSSLDTVPDVGGKLTQWHVHADLCFTDDPVAPRLAFGGGLVTAPEEPCRPPLQKRGNVPMIHVWIVPHECGPFAALEGLGGGQIKPGEERLCDHAHGSTT